MNGEEEEIGVGDGVGEVLESPVESIVTARALIYSHHHLLLLPNTASLIFLHFFRIARYLCAPAVQPIKPGFIRNLNATNSHQSTHHGSRALPKSNLNETIWYWIGRYTIHICQKISLKISLVLNPEKFSGVRRHLVKHSGTGFNVETVEYKNISFTVWDVGGQDKCLLRQEIKDFWRVALLASMLLYPANIDVTTYSSDEQFKLEKRSESFKMIENAIIELGKAKVKERKNNKEEKGKLINRLSIKNSRFCLSPPRANSYGSKLSG
ncbi:unnamed protein product [Camellia sinensis]